MIKLNMLSKNIGIWLVAAIIFLLLGVLLFAGDRPLLVQWRNLPAKVVFHTGKGQINFEIEVADTDKKRRKGLMYREKLAENSGMLFVFPKSDIRSFWMKNTLIKLDMVFISKDLQVVYIAHSAPPCREMPCPGYSSIYPVRYVVELNGGACYRRGIKTGDKVEIEGL